MMEIVDRRWRLFAAVALLSFAADHGTKLWARHALPTDSRGFGIPVEVIANYWDWQLAYNTGSAFSMFDGAWLFLTAVGFGALGVILWMAHKARPGQRRLLWALGLVAGGAVGNLADRIVLGKVTDFVVWKYHDLQWPIFNVADVALCIGVGLLILDSVKNPTKQAEATENAASETAPAVSPGE